MGEHLARAVSAGAGAGKEVDEHDGPGDERGGDEGDENPGLAASSQSRIGAVVPTAHTIADSASPASAPTDNLTGACQAIEEAIAAELERFPAGYAGRENILRGGEVASYLSVGTATPTQTAVIYRALAST